MARAARSTAAPAPPSEFVTREAFVLAAVELLREGGAAALTTRALAARVGVATGTPFNYFRSKDEIIAAVLEHIVAQTTFPAPDPDHWETCLRDQLVTLWDAFEPYVGLESLLLTGDIAVRSPTALSLGRYSQELLEQAGEAQEFIELVQYALYSYVLGAQFGRGWARGASRAASRERFTLTLEALLAGLAASPLCQRRRRRPSA
jgi:AcrR family transcriptional regulator